MGPASNEERMSSMRDDLTRLIDNAKDIASERPEYGAEVALAQRHLEDARMRLGVALAMSRGDDPFAFKQPGE